MFPRPITSSIMSNRYGLSEDPSCKPTHNCDLAHHSYTGLNLCSCIITRVFHKAHIFFRNTCSLKHLQISCRGTLAYAFSRSINTMCRSVCISRCFSITCLAANMASVVPLPSMKPNCSSPMRVSSLSLLSIMNSQNRTCLTYCTHN